MFDMTNGVLKGLGIAALICALLAVIIPIYGFWVSALSIVFVVITALAGDRVFPTIVPIVAGINSYFLSPSLWLLYDGLGRPGSAIRLVFVIVCLMFLLAPFVAMTLHAKIRKT